jgi:hypothetical protein
MADIRRRLTLAGEKGSTRKIPFGKLKGRLSLRLKTATLSSPDVAGASFFGRKSTAEVSCQLPIFLMAPSGVCSVPSLLISKP